MPQHIFQPGFPPQVQIVEAREVPAVVPDGFVYRTLPGTGRTQLGSRIVEVPDDFSRFGFRDNTVGYTAYVPVGAVARGRGLALTGDGGRTQPCRSCRGANLTGVIRPPLAGRSPTYIIRQLYAFHTGGRNGPSGGPMKVVTPRLSLSDMIDLATYVATSKP